MGGDRPDWFCSCLFGKTIGLPIEARRKIALNAVLIAAGILIFFLIGGQVLLESMQIPLPAFQAAGGLVLLLFALTMILAKASPSKKCGSAVI